jgi:hypothetical protein
MRPLRVLGDSAWLLLFATFKFAIHLGGGGGYGYHRDEMYYLICADHLAWGYVDHPPLSVLLIAATRAVAGASVAAIRLAPAVAGAVTVFLIGRMARQLGGRWMAQALAMIAAIAAPFYLALDHYFSMNAFDVLVWSIAASLMIGILQGGPDRLWVWLGIILGIGLENKVSVLWLAGALGVGLLLSPQRALLRTRGPWITAAIAAALALPYAIWQVAHRFPTIEFMRESTSLKLAAHWVGPFLVAELRGMLPIASPIWVAGLLYLLWFERSHRYRALGWAWVAVFALLAATSTTRSAYLAPAYTWLLPAGAVAIERSLRGWRQLLAVAYALVILLGGAVAAPFVMPIVPRQTLLAYAPTNDVEERTGGPQVSEFLAQMTPWQEIVGQVAAVYGTIDPAARASTSIIAPNYGIASAIDVLGRERGLPPALSGHNNYWLWGLRGQQPQTFIVIGSSEAGLRRSFDNVLRAGETRCELCMNYDNHQPIWIAHGIRRPAASSTREAAIRRPTGTRCSSPTGRGAASG